VTKGEVVYPMRSIGMIPHNATVIGKSVWLA